MDESYRALNEWLEATQDEPLEGMAGFFDARIHEYEAHMAPWKDHYVWMAQLLPEGTASLLDLGCGTGLELDAIFARFPSMEVTGVDLSEKMLEQLRRKHGDKDLTLLCEDYFRCEMEAGRFDAVISFETLHHFTQKEKTALFEKVYRWLKPGGCYLECDYISTSREMETLAFEECRRRRIRDGIPDGVFVHFDTPLTLEHECQALLDAGFPAVEVVGFLPGDDHTPMIRAVK